MNPESAVVDVIVAGAGMAGATAAFVLARKGFKVVLIDPAATQPPVFRAEKIEPDQAEMLREMQLMEWVLPQCRRIHRIACVHEGRVWKYSETDEYGCFYHDMVNAVRGALPEAVQLRIARVTGIQTSADLQEVTLSDGTVVRGRLLVLSTGAGGKLTEQLGLKREMISAQHSVTLGFDLKANAQLPGGADSMTCREKPLRSGIDYVTLFPIKDVLRVNVFAYWDAKDPRFQELRTHGMAALLKFMPGLTRIAGGLVQTSKVEAMPIHLYRIEPAAQPGVVLLGDAFQSVCPTTGTGLSKILVDVKTLAGYVTEWFGTPGMPAAKTGQYYADPAKQASDSRSLGYALYSKQLCSGRSLKWQLRRWKKYLPRWLAGLRGVAPPLQDMTVPNPAS